MLWKYKKCYQETNEDSYTTLQLGLISSESNTIDACPYELEDVVYILKVGPGDIVSVGDRVYLDNLMTTNFVGDNDYWHLNIQSSIYSVSVKIDSLGYITSGENLICIIPV
jgi:hypothetical protein